MTNLAGTIVSLAVTTFFVVFAVVVWAFHPETSSGPVRMELVFIPATFWSEALTIVIIAPSKAGLIAANVMGLGLVYFGGNVHFYWGLLKEMAAATRQAFGGLSIETK